MLAHIPNDEGYDQQGQRGRVLGTYPQGKATQEGRHNGGPGTRWPFPPRPSKPGRERPQHRHHARRIAESFLSRQPTHRQQSVQQSSHEAPRPTSGDQGPADLGDEHHAECATERTEGCQPARGIATQAGEQPPCCNIDGEPWRMGLLQPEVEVAESQDKTIAIKVIGRGASKRQVKQRQRDEEQELPGPEAPQTSPPSPI